MSRPMSSSGVAEYLLTCIREGSKNAFFGDDADCVQQKVQQVRVH